MKLVLLPQAIKLNRARKWSRFWHKTVLSMAAVVVFLTTYALILPAITMEQVLICPIPAHSHEDHCYEHIPLYDLHCTFTAEEGIPVIHEHSADCYDRDGVLQCTLTERIAHVHDEQCYGDAPLLCQLEETEGHVHSDSCTSELSLSCTIAEGEGHTHGPACTVQEQVLTCELPEDENHTHDESCYVTETIVCELEEIPPHTHDDSCYAIQQVECLIPEGEGHSHSEACYGEKPLICELEQIQPHCHDERCYDAQGNMVCTLPEVAAHTHGEACLVDTGTYLTQLICEEMEHLHQDSCYADDTIPTEIEFICGFGEHTHNELCENTEKPCSIPEHTHDAACVIADLDLTVNREAKEQWDSMFRDMELSGNWQEDLVKIAQSQLDYRESRRNCKLVGAHLKGYTRYGAYHDDPYGDWSAYFVRFCMDYADIDYYPQQSGPAQWMQLLAQEELFFSPEDHLPEAGDLIFLYMGEETENAPAADHMGIVQAVIPTADGTAAAIRTIEGDVSDRVSYGAYESDDIRILGYGRMLPGYATNLQCSGSDYTITATFPQNAKIPVTATLHAAEIPPDSEEYAFYHSQCVQSLLAQSEVQMEEELNLTFARYFDIHFMLNGEILEPAAPVSIQIQYAEPIAVEKDQSGAAVHFAEDGIEILNAVLSGVLPLDEPAEEPMQQVDTFSFTQSGFSVVGTVLANARATPVTVWLDGTCGGLAAYDGSDNQLRTLEDRRLPETWKSPTKYEYVLNGWYDITNNKYYAPGALLDAEVTGYAVFYADWIAKNYNLGEPNASTVDSLDTSEFVTTYLFDYNALFNLQSADLSSGWSNNSGHGETWSLVENGNVDYEGKTTLDFLFRDHDGQGTLTHPTIPDGSSIRNEPNGDQLNAITPGIYSPNLGRILFDPNSTAVGKLCLGTGNYLYQYMDNPSDAHYGYYYYDSFKNAVTYNRQEERFYVHNYLEYTQDTVNNNLSGTNADFLPLNYGQSVYAARRNQSPPVMANYCFGMRSDIHFYLPNDAGARDANGNYLNKSTTGDDMIFEFSGDDDVWVLVDGKLLLDVGGIHQVRGGRIDFSQGVVYTTRGNSNEYEARTFEQILGAGNNILEGSHDLSFYYLERGGSMSNCAIYFNLAPRYGLNLLKEDYVTGEAISGVTFQVFNDEDCTVPAKLWTSHAAAKRDEESVHVFTTGANGIAHMWGFVAGKTYYIKETAVPAGYAVHNNLIRVTLNNHGTDISEVTIIRNDGSVKGFEVTAQSMNKEEHLISMSITNKQVEDQLMDYRVEKQWGNGTSRETPVQFYLLANGARQGQPVTLSVDNSWGHTWHDLPVEDASGNLITYSAEEIHLPGYTLEGVEESRLASDKVSWVKVGALEDNATFLLMLGSDTALTATSGSFGTVDLNTARNHSNAQWQALVYHDGFRLCCGSSYLSFNNDSKRFYLTSGTDGNQAFYYDGTNLFVMSGNNRYYMGDWNGGPTAGTAENATGIFKKVVTRQGTTVLEFTNTEIPEELQSHLQVEKYWEGNYTSLPEKLTVTLKRGNSVVTTLELTAENNWSATVDGLDKEILAANGYTLEEDIPFGFSPKISQIQDVSTDRWNWNSGQNGLVTGQTYVFTANGRALADDGGRPRATTYYGTPATNQQWQVVESTQSGGSTIQVLKNVATGRYLQELNQNISLVDAATGNCRVRLLNNRLQYYPQDDGGGWSLNFDGENITFGWGHNSGTALTLYQREVSSAYLITVTNVYGTYVMPNTGGGGTELFYLFGSLLLLAAALMCLAERRRQKGGV